MATLSGDPRELLAEQWYRTLDTSIKLFGPERAMMAMIPHAFTRATGNGVEYAEVERVARRLRDFASWNGAWTQSAEAKEEQARRAAAEGRLATARDAYLQAAYLHHYAQLFVRPDQADKLDSRRRSEVCYAHAAPLLDPPARRVEVPYAQGPLPGYLRLPPGVGPMAAVVMINGADSTKEELHHWAGYLVHRGMAVLYFDGPGQGETAGRMAMPVEFELSVAAAVDWLRAQPGIDPGRIAVWGISTGGYLAARSAAHVRGLAAAVSVGGFYDARRFADWPCTTQENFCLMFDLVGRIGAMQDLVRERITLRGLLGAVDCPFLIVHGGRDHLFGMDEVQRMADEIRGAELVVFAEGDHALCNEHLQAGWLYGDWLGERLRVR